jgi:hypothetical protein
MMETLKHSLNIDVVFILFLPRYRSPIKPDSLHPGPVEITSFRETHIYITSSE